MSYVYYLLDKFSITDKNARNPDVNLYTSTMRTLAGQENYNLGKFMTKLLTRIELRDDFRTDALACAKFNPYTRRLMISFNPLMLWDFMLRGQATEKDNKDEIQEIDRVLIGAFKDNGWTKENFAIWSGFMMKYNSRDGMGRTFASVIVHELLHLIWNHLSSPRRKIKDEDVSAQFAARLTNIAMDFSINQTLDFGPNNKTLMTTHNHELLLSFNHGNAPMKSLDDMKHVRCNSDGEKYITDFNEKNIRIEYFDDNFLNQPYEYYYHLLRNAPKDEQEKLAGSQMKSSMFGIPMSLDEMFEHIDASDLSEEDKQRLKAEISGCGGNGGVEAGAAGPGTEFEGFNPTPSEVKKVSRNDVKRTVDDMLKKGEIKDPSEVFSGNPFHINNALTTLIANLYKTPTKSWDTILRHEIMKAVGCNDFEYTMKRCHRALPDVYPGKAREKGIDLILIEDTSGSINLEDCNRFRNEMVRATREVDTPAVRYIQFHGEVSFDKMVPINKLFSIGIAETGGTALKVPLDMLKREGNKKTVLVFTDGYIDDGYNQSDYHFKIIVFVSSSGHQSCCQGLSERGFTVIAQDGDNVWAK